MGRYDIARNRFTRKALRFFPSRSVSVLTKNIQKCIDDNADMDASNQSETVLEQAAVNVARSNVVSIVVDSISRARIMRMTYGYLEVYTADDIPEGRHSVILFGNTARPPTATSLTRLRLT